MYTELWHFFAAQLQPLPNVPKDKKERVKLHMKGATLSNEEVMESQKQQEEQKKAAIKGIRRRAKADENKWSQEKLIPLEELTIFRRGDHSRCRHKPLL